jgi:hypothetical protein
MSGGWPDLAGNPRPSNSVRVVDGRSEGEWWPGVATWSARVKFALFGLALLYTLGGVVIRFV